MAQAKFTNLSHIMDFSLPILILMPFLFTANAMTSNAMTSNIDDLCQEGADIPARCKGRYKDGMLIVDCHSANLTALPKPLPASTSVLYLQGNNIPVIPSYSFIGCHDMLYLDLSHNHLHTILPKAFEDLHNLTHLYLDHNYLDFASTIHVQSDIFHPTQSLETLYIHHNMWMNGTQYRDNIFTNHTKIRILAVDGVPVPYAILGQGFENLKYLEQLYFQAGLRYVGNETFSWLANCPLKKLVIHTGLLMDLDTMAFSHFKHLEKLDLSYNPLLGLQNASKSWYCLQFTNIQTLRLQYSVPFERQVILVEKSFYRHLDKTSIKGLYLDGNNIITIYANLKKSLPHLVHLSLSYNRLSQVNKFIKDAFSLPQLRRVNANYQTRRKLISELALIVGHGRPDPPKGNVNSPQVSNNIPMISAQTFGKYYETIIPLHNYSITHVDVGLPEPLPHPAELLYIKLAPNLEELHLSESLSVDWYTFPNITMEGPSNLKILDYSGNGLAILKGPVLFLNHAILDLTVDLSRNKAVYMDPNFGQLVNCPEGKIVAINVSENKLGPQLKEGMDIFRSYLDLRVLDLSENYIYHLPFDIFQPLKKLELLVLSKNSLREIAISSNTFQSLLHLDLSGNLLSSLKQGTLESLEKHGKQLTVVLADNPFICSCDTLDFMIWVLETEVNLPGYLEYECSYRGSLSRFQDLDTMINELNIECSKTTIILGVTVPVVLIVIIIALSVCCHRHRWEIRFWFMHKVIRKKPLAHNRTFTHDAFVSFQEKDLHFVKKELIPNLEGYASEEGERNFRLNIHHRDFPAGHPIADNIYEAIENSRKTLVVLSNNYVESEWTYYELQLATMRTLDDGMGIIIVIVLESVPKEKMKYALLELLQHNTFIEWPSNEADKPLFWRRLREAIKEDAPRAVMCQKCAKIVYQKKSRKENNRNGIDDDPPTREVVTWNPVFVEDENIVTLTWNPALVEDENIEPGSDDKFCK